MLSFLFVDKEHFWLRKCPSRNSTMFASQRSPKCPVLKVIQCRRIFEDFASTFFTLWSRKITFLKGNLCMYKCFTNVYKFCHRRLRKMAKCSPIWGWILCWILPCAHLFFPAFRLTVYFLSLFIRNIISKHDRETTASLLRRRGRII